MLDLKFALRSLARTPGFVAVTLLTVASGASRATGSSIEASQSRES